jgi:hypothetical protein
MKKDKRLYEFEIYYESKDRLNKYVVFEKQLINGCKCLINWNNYKRKCKIPITIDGVKYSYLKFKKELKGGVSK